MAQDFPRNPIDKENFQLVFNDDFDGNTLNTEHWVPYYLPHWSSKDRSATNYLIDSGLLILKIDRDQEPWSPEFNGEVKVSSLQTGLFAGHLGSAIGQHRPSIEAIVREEQTTQRLHTQRYGYFEIRARAVRSDKNVCAFWMIGFEEVPEESAEICIMEIKGHQMTEKTAVNGYGVRAFKDPSIRDEFFEETFDFNAADFHIYAAEWRPDGIDFFIDNQKVRSISQSPSYPMQFMLNIYEVPTELTHEPKETPYPKMFEIDYVRAYQAPGID